jgi:hypothetical protein
MSLPFFVFHNGKRKGEEWERLEPKKPTGN